MSHAMRILTACVVLLVGCNRADRESIRIESNTRAWREMPPISTDSSAGVELQTRMLAALQKAQLKEGLTSPTIGASIVTLRKSEIAIIVYWVEQSPTVTEVVVGVNNERARFPLSSDERLRLSTLSKEGDLTLYTSITLPIGSPVGTQLWNGFRTVRPRIELIVDGMTVDNDSDVIWMREEANVDKS
jgi:hypothetical protein